MPVQALINVVQKSSIKESRCFIYFLVHKFWYYIIRSDFFHSQRANLNDCI